MDTDRKEIVKTSVMEHADELAALICGLKHGERLLIGRSRKHGFKVSKQKLTPVYLDGRGGDAE